MYWATLSDLLASSFKFIILNDAVSLLLDIGFLIKHTYKARMSKIKQLLLRGDIKDTEVPLIRGIVSQVRSAIKNSKSNNL